MSSETDQPNDILDLVDAATRAFRGAASVEDTAVGWDYFSRVESYVEMTWPNDKDLLDVLYQAKRYLSQFTLDLRNGVPSPFNGWASTMGRLRAMVDTPYGLDGYPK
ncbi:hypothetical protein ACFSE1_01105 [Rhizobium helianthi]|uniref:Uncharacterized protein n=1 Tax=Rhizobium helianthi TaxID=1132695 RepID=A0ABW4LXY9_9HYPH